MGKITEEIIGCIKGVATQKNLRHGGSKQSDVPCRQQNICTTATNQIRNEFLGSDKSGGRTDGFVPELNERHIRLISKFLAQERRDQDCGTEIRSRREMRHNVAHISWTASRTGRGGIYEEMYHRRGKGIVAVLRPRREKGSSAC